MKRLFCLILVGLLVLGLAGCGPQSSDKLQVICTVFPQYDWMRNIVGERENVEISLLMDSGADLHNYQTNATDLYAISTCDLFVYVGGESDNWVADALKNPANKERKSLALIDVVDPMESEHEHEEHEEHHHEVDEHVWLSLKNADKIIERLAALMAEIDPEGAAVYAENAKEYRGKLAALDADYQECVAGAKRNKLLFADRFPFSYLAKDYGLEHFAAFSGCSAEVEVSFSTLADLIKYTDDNQLPYIMVTESGDQELAKAVIAKSAAKNQKILVMDSLQSVNRLRIDEGATYYGIMESNLAVLQQALY
ncbi:MAG: zinc ABC transporter substrate-binding protein [Clostridia bacterium]|nr:zinc ABC transporter substrate-binding protein [Clostridia bacterium]